MGLTLLDIQRFNEADALDFFRRVRWPGTHGAPVCFCGSTVATRLSTKPVFKCARCGHQFSEFSSGPFASKKLAARDLLCAVAAFATARKGISALQLSKNLGLHYKTCFVLCHKLRELIHSAQCNIVLSGIVEVDGACFGGYRRQENVHSGRFEKRFTIKHFEQRRVVVVARERGGRTLTFVGRKESDCVKALSRQFAPSVVVHADGARAWDSMIEAYEMLRLNHNFAYSADGACTNNAESFFAMMRRQQRGTHHRMSGDLLHLYAAEMAWRQDNRLADAETLIVELATLAVHGQTSANWAGYWQRQKGTEAPPKAPRSTEINDADENASPQRISACA